MKWLSLTKTRAMLLRVLTNFLDEEELNAVLERARTAGFLGPGPLRVHTEHALSFGRAIPASAITMLDLGSGGGVPGLPLFVRHPHLEGVLLDASEKRCAFLSWAVVELGLSHRVEVVRGRSEDLAHQVELRGAFSIVTCRGFGPPAATIEAGVGFLEKAGLLVISEPPGARSWSSVALAEVGLTQVDQVAENDSPGLGNDHQVAVFRMDGVVPSEIPRALRRQRSRPFGVLD